MNTKQIFHSKSDKISLISDKNAQSNMDIIYFYSDII
jgi:hypothetical protein